MQWVLTRTQKRLPVNLAFEPLQLLHRRVARLTQLVQPL